MSFGEAVRSVYRNYATFDGRATRSEYWWFQLFLLLVLVGFAILGSVLFAVSRSSVAISAVGSGFGIFILGSLVPSLAVTVRRLHDSDKSGWWMLIGLVPYIGGIILFIFTLLPSSIGFNRFGPPQGEQPGDQRVQYFGPSRGEAWQKFTADAADAAASGYHPVSQSWRAYSGGEVLEVVYRGRPLDPPWRSPLGPFPGSGQDQGSAGQGGSGPPPTWS